MTNTLRVTVFENCRLSDIEVNQRSNCEERVVLRNCKIHTSEKFNRV